MEPRPGKPTRLQPETAVRITQFLVGAVAIAGLFYLLQFSTTSICCGDYDGYYHIKWSRTLGDKGGRFPPEFPWLPLTTLNPKVRRSSSALSHHADPVRGVVRSANGREGLVNLFATLAVLSCYWLLIYFRIRFVLVWLVALLACSVPFLFRMNMAKAPPLAIVYLIIAICLFFKKYWPLLPLALVFTWTYDLFVLLLATVFWVLVIAWAEGDLNGGRCFG